MKLKCDKEKLKKQIKLIQFNLIKIKNFTKNLQDKNVFIKKDGTKQREKEKNSKDT